MPALGKVCPQCSSVEHCRRLVCVKCGYVFTKSVSISKKKCMASARLCDSEQESCVRRAKNKQRMASARACFINHYVRLLPMIFPPNIGFFQYENIELN